MSYGECGPNSSLNVQFFKEILGGEKQTARPLFGQLVSFYARCIHLLPLNNLLKIHNTDYATWRRVVLIKHTIKFFNRASPDYDPLNPNHRIQDKYLPDPSKLAQDPLYLEALLSFLVYTWERMQFKYDGDIDKIRRTFDVDFIDCGAAAKICVDQASNTQILREVCAVISFVCKPFAAPVFTDLESHRDWVNFLSHLISPPSSLA
jgi:hypothetical protein